MSKDLSIGRSVGDGNGAAVGELVDGIGGRAGRLVAESFVGAMRSIICGLEVRNAALKDERSGLATCV